MSKPPAMSGNNLPPEIIESILRLLPAKSLGRFKSVSKRWNSLISDPRFIKTHLLLLLNIHQRHQTTKLIIVCNARSLYSVDTSQLFKSSGDISVTGKKVSFMSHPTGWKDIWGSCNGLVLAKDENDTIFLMNPTTQELWQIPPSPFNGDMYVSYGLCYDSSTDDYKLLSISFWYPNYEHDTEMHLSVYSLRNNSWRKLPDSPYDHLAAHLISCAFINLDLNFYWSACPSTIVAFSLAHEEFNRIKLPVNDDNFVPYYLLDIGGKLGVILSIIGEGRELWVMNESSWTRVCSFGHIEIDIQRFPLKPVCLVEGSNRIIVWDDNKEDAVVVCNIVERRCTSVRIVGGSSRLRFFVDGTYVETLESPNRIITPLITSV